MANSEHVAQQQELLQAHRRTLAVYFNQLAAFGGRAYATPALLNGIEEAWVNICLLKERLQQLGALVEADITDDLMASMHSMRDSQRYPRRAGDTPLGTSLLLSRFDIGLGTLRTLAEQVPQIRDAAIEFRTLFQAACDQINTLRAYKSLHDLLHEVQLLCFENIEQELPRFPEDDLSVDNLERYALNLEDIVASLREVAEQSPIIKPAPTWILKLSQLHSQICQALAARDGNLLRRATDQIRRILSLYPAQINMQLNSTVRTMRLSTLIEVMMYIRDVCVSLNLEVSSIERIESGLAALRELHQHLTMLIDDHDSWQLVDNLLRTIDDYFDQDEVITMWSELKEQATRLYETSSEQWALALKTNADQLERAVLTRDHFNITQQLRSYRSRAVRQFYRVDKRLKDVCEKLDRLDGPLAFVIGVLE
jgi:hypothetical protein